MALIAQLGEHCTGTAEVVGSNPAQSLKIFSGLCSSSVTAALALITVITQLLLWDKLLSSLLYLGQVLTSPYKGLTHIRPLSCGFDSSVQCSPNPAQSLKIFSGLCSSSVTAALALITVITQLLLWDKLLSSLLYLGQVLTSPYKGLTHIRPLSCGFDSSVGRALHRHRRGRGFESRSEPENFFRSLFK